ncbi:MAG: hypothetical protein ACKON7_03405 [Planctomycetaceae bacterium]
MTVEPLLVDSAAKLRAALALLFASAEAYHPFDPGRTYVPKEREPYDALSDRFLRGYESALKFFRTWERVREAAVSETFRDLLLRMEKLDLVSSHDCWIALRDLRNRVVHDYLPSDLAALYGLIVAEAVPEFRRLESAIARRLSP